MKPSIQTRVADVRERIRRSAEANGRPASAVRLIAASKTFPVQAIVAAAAAGVADIGENYIQEAREKHELLKLLPVRWHFIGHLQTNKVRYAVRMFDLIHTVDSFRLAAEIERCACLLERVQPVLVQVNISGEATKSGVSPAKALPLVEEIASLEHVQVKGLMTMPPYFNEPERTQPIFAELRRLRDRIRESGVPRIGMDELSMGMTGDFEAAIAEGATLLRIGTAIFGERR